MSARKCKNIISKLFPKTTQFQNAFENLKIYVIPYQKLYYQGSTKDAKTNVFIQHFKVPLDFEVFQIYVISQYKLC